MTSSTIPGFRWSYRHVGPRIPDTYDVEFAGMALGGSPTFQILSFTGVRTENDNIITYTNTYETSSVKYILVTKNADSDITATISINGEIVKTSSPSPTTPSFVTADSGNVSFFAEWRKSPNDVLFVNNIEIAMNTEERANLNPTIPLSLLGASKHTHKPLYSLHNIHNMSEGRLSNMTTNTFEKCPRINMYYKTDVMGSELGEMWAVLENTQPARYIGEYENKLVGYFDVNQKNNIPATQSIFSYKPNLQKVLLSRGKTLLAQILNIYSERRNARNVVSEFSESEPTEKEFFDLLMTYSTLRFMFSGLITNGKFEVEWLYRKYTKSFLVKLSKSDFACFLPLFTDPQFGLVGYDKYYKNGPCVC